MTINTLIKAKKRGKTWAMLTAYDAPTAELLEACGVDFILVGDSVGMVLLGYSTTLPVTMDEMIHHAKAVRRGAKKAYLIGDLPLKGVDKGPEQTLVSARRFIEEAGCDAVKLEWNSQALAATDLMLRHKIPVMGHLGLTPQTAADKSGFRVQGRDAQAALEILKKARDWEKHGIFSLLVECVPSPVAREITRRLSIPTIGIGAGADCDGQVLVFQDLVGAFTKFEPRFVKHYARLAPLMKKAVTNYVSDVKRGTFPQKKHTFSMKADELAQFKQQL